MNKKSYLPFIGLVLTMAWSGCERVETEPRDLIRQESLWDEKDTNATQAQAFLADVYNYIPGGFNRIGGAPGDFLDDASGDAIPSRTNRVVEYYTNGVVSAVNNPDPYWGNSYAGIRRANIFLANIDRVPTTAANLTRWKAEVRYIRALLYFELVKRYGGVPLIGDKIFTLEDNLSVPRNTYEECVSYIVAECDAIKGDLRAEGTATLPDSDWGRIPRGAASALKSRLLLYAASPLYNGGVIGGSPLNGYLSYDAARWQKALDATQELINLNYYALQPVFTNTFLVKRNTEIILAKQSVDNTTLENNNAPIGYSSPATSQGLTSPTQDFVEAFPTLAGLDISNPAAGYNAQTPYANRDPRLAASVFVNGTAWLGRSIETFDGGRDRPGGGAVQTRTGYYLRKFLGNFATNSTYTNQSHTFPLFRYAEMLLNKAEALNELGQTEPAVAEVIRLRTRAGITAGVGNRYGIKAGISQVEARELIRTERRLELAFEEHRFWDVRRWKTAETALSGTLNGIKITRLTATPATYRYDKVQVSTMVFQPKLYYMPIPYDEITKNPSLIQNPGW